MQQFLRVKVIYNQNQRLITLVYNIYINKITKKFKLNNIIFLRTLLSLKELIKNSRKVTKQEIKAY